MSDIIDVKAVDSERAQSLKTVGWVSYILHLVVAVGAVLPGAQASPVLLIIALIIDLREERAMPRAPGRRVISLGAFARCIWAGCALSW